MKKLKIISIVLLGVISFAPVKAQTQTPRQQGQGFNPGQMVDEEKNKVYEKITTLTADQKEVIDIIYDDYKKSFAKAREDANGDFTGMREVMLGIRKEKDDSMKEVLNEEQFKQYTELMDEIRQSRRRGGQ